MYLLYQKFPQGNVDINQDCRSTWYCQLEEHQAEMKYEVEEQYMET